MAMTERSSRNSANRAWKGKGDAILICDVCGQHERARRFRFRVDERLWARCPYCKMEQRSKR